MGFREQSQENMKRARRYQPVSALIRALPANGKWMPGERERWFRAVESTVDYCVEIPPPNAGSPDIEK